jgi:hypothetical protein
VGPLSKITKIKLGSRAEQNKTMQAGFSKMHLLVVFLIKSEPDYAEFQSERHRKWMARCARKLNLYVCIKLTEN